MEQLLTEGIVQSEILNNKSTFILCSYYWGKGRVNKGSIKKLTYDQQVDRIIEDCRRCKVNYYFVRYPSLEQSGKYQEALGLKPYFIQKALDEFPQYKCIFVDTDLRLLRYPHLFDMDADCWFVNWNELDYNCYNPLQLELPGAILGFANTHNARTMLDILTKKIDIRYAEDKTFSGIISRNFMNIYLRCVWLPENYLYLFQKHVYEPGVGYTHLASYREEFKNNRYKISDIVFAHEDFETGALEDVYKERVGRSRWPPNVDRQLGQKLRCYNMKFHTYVNWGMTTEQQKQLSVDIKMRQRSSIVTVKRVKSENEFKFPRMLKREEKSTDSPFSIATMIDNNTTKKDIDEFKNNCDKLNVSYKIYKVDDLSKINKPLALYKILKKSDKAIVYIDIDMKLKKKPEMFYIKNMDFMMTNLNAEFKKSNCYDPRILKAKHEDLLYLNKNQLVIKLLLIWGNYNKKEHIKNNLQNKSLEYAFNVSNAVNKMRCYWFTDKYDNGSIIKYKNKSKFEKSGYVEDIKKVKILTRALEQCGVKPSRSTSSQPYAVHHYGSKGRRGINRYGKTFIKF
jgi:hypothetical protein